MNSVMTEKPIRNTTNQQIDRQNQINNMFNLASNRYISILNIQIISFY